MTELIQVPEVVPVSEIAAASPDVSHSDPRYIEKALLGSAGIASVVWLGLLGWLIWWLLI
ncbi:hypothetical protein [Bosea sp. PAMC 26642]|uniref:hypothetical protein n=1 Tax=Bosea sp. (strain PAMC 26642) TaxID=1792307 RepID=UPI0012E75CF1|nr:hypothetical protein [Bosea sp. PAMC 26642]